MKNLKKFILIAFAFLLVLSSTACANPEKIAEENVEKTLGLLQRLDRAEFEREFGIEEAAETFDFKNDMQEQIAKTFFSKLTYEIKEVVKEDDKVIVTTEITIPDLEEVTTKVFDDVILTLMDNLENATEDEIAEYTEQKFLEFLKDPNVQMKTDTIYIVNEKIDGKWQIVDTADLFKAMYGDLAL